MAQMHEEWGVNCGAAYYYYYLWKNPSYSKQVI